MIRQETRVAFKKYMEDHCLQKGRQKSNLTKGELRGLKTLKKRVKDGEIVVLPTDKSGLFAVMKRETYT